MIKKTSNNMPKSVPTTGRTPEFLARRHGYASLKSMVKDIPKAGVVLDIGAGMSLLGHAVCKTKA